MTAPEETPTTLDRQKIVEAIKTGSLFSIFTYTLPHQMEAFMEQTLEVFLEELQHADMAKYLSYCLKELVTNAKKANTKRVYFAEKNLDINDKANYEQGMKTFKMDTLGDIQKYLAMQKAAGLYVRLSFLRQDKNLLIEVTNNSALTIFEYKRIHDKMSRASQYTSIEEAMQCVLDDTEGAGLGLIITLLMLQKIGHTEESLQCIAANNETTMRLTIRV